MGYGTKSELELGFDFMLKRIDPFGRGMSFEDLFPEFVEEAKRVGVDNKEYEDRVNSMGFLPCIDALNPDEIFFFDELNDEENALIFFIDHPVLLAVKDSSVPIICENENEDCLKVFVTGNLKRARNLRKKLEFVMAYLPNGAAVFV